MIFPPRKGPRPEWARRMMTFLAQLDPNLTGWTVAGILGLVILYMITSDSNPFSSTQRARTVPTTTFPQKAP